MQYYVCISDDHGITSALKDPVSNTILRFVSSEAAIAFIHGMESYNFQTTDLSLVLATLIQCQNFKMCSKHFVWYDGHTVDVYLSDIDKLCHCISLAGDYIS